MIAVIDYGVGNLFSLTSSLKAVGAEAEVTSDPERLRRADRIILPGVGAFADAARKLKDTGLVPVLYEECGKNSDNPEIAAQGKYAKPLLGICLGMQMLFEKSYEYGEHEGLGFIKGKVIPFRLPDEYKVPHMGWNSLRLDKKDSPLFKYVKENEYVYFVHSYYADDCIENTAATAEYGVRVTAAAENGNIFGTQFHPEKSGDTGLKILKAFCEIQ